MKFYNEERYHQSLGYLKPVDIYFKKTLKKKDFLIG